MCTGGDSSSSKITKYGYSLDHLYQVAVEGLRKLDNQVCTNNGNVVDGGAAEGMCEECHANDNPFVLDSKNNELVCRHCGFVDPQPIQCEWDGSSQHLILGGRRMRRKTVPYNHTYYFSEKMRCANGEGILLDLLLSISHARFHVVHKLVKCTIAHVLDVVAEIPKRHISATTPVSSARPGGCSSLLLFVLASPAAQLCYA